MSTNGNLVLKWAKNIKSDADEALASLGCTAATVSIIKAIRCLSEIKGCCEAIIAATEQTLPASSSSDPLCNHCRHGGSFKSSECLHCIHGAGTEERFREE